MPVIKFVDEEDIVTNSGGSGRELNEDIFAEFAGQKMAAGEFASGDLAISASGQAVDEEGRPVPGAYVDYLLVLPQSNPDREDHEISNDERAKRQTACYKFCVGMSPDFPRKKIWKKELEAWFDPETDEPVSDGVAFNRDVVRQAVNRVAEIYNSLPAPTDKAFGERQDVEGFTGVNFFGKIVKGKNGRFKIWQPLNKNQLPDSVDVCYTVDELFAKATAA